ncbi:MAG: hypothetical protein II543_05105, partial [Desulfovibrio sp.]|nr:hypothetical protein [Desulfovibrio sp.]
MRLAPLCLALLFALAFCPRELTAARSAAPAQAGRPVASSGQHAGQLVTQEALQGFWLGSEGGRDVVCHFSAFF